MFRKLVMLIAIIFAIFIGLLPQLSKAQFERYIVAIEWSPDGTKIAVSYGGSGTEIIDVATSEVHISLPDPLNVRQMAWSPDGELLAIGAERIYIFDPETGEQHSRLAGGTAIYSIAWSNDSTQIAIAAQNGLGSGAQHYILVRDITTGTEVAYHERGREGTPADSQNVIAWSPINDQLIVANLDYPTTIIDVISGDTLLDFGSVPATIAVWSPNGAQIATAYGTYVQLWDAYTGESVQVIELEALDLMSVWSLAWHPDGAQIAIGAYNELYLWDISSQDVRVLATEITGGVDDVSWSPDGNLLAYDNADVVEFLDVSTIAAQANAQPAFSGILSVAISPDGTMIAGGGVDLLRVWDLNNNLLLDFEGINEHIYSVVWSPDSTRIATGGSGQTVNMWNVNGPEFAAGKSITSYETIEDPIRSLAWNPNGSRIVGVTREGSNTLYVWDAIDYTPTPIQQEQISNLLEITWSPNGEHIAIASEVGIFLFNSSLHINTGDLAIYLSGPFIVTPTVAWRPDGSLIAAGDVRGQIHMINPDSGETIQSFQIHDDTVIAILWQPTSNAIIATSSVDSAIKIWDADSGEIFQTIIVDAQTRVFTMTWSLDGCTLFHGNSSGGLSSIPLEASSCE